MRKLMALVLVGSLGMLLTPTAALADKPGPWSPSPTSDFTLAAGTRCPFTLGGEVLSDKERIRTLSGSCWSAEDQIYQPRHRRVRCSQPDRHRHHRFPARRLRGTDTAGRALRCGSRPYR
jgi:hypothetical protein